MKKKYSLLLFAILVSVSSFARWNENQVLQFRYLSTQNGLPTNEVRRIFQDREGYIWIATTSGLCLFDGYNIKTFKSNLYTPGLLNNNNIRCLADDDSGNMWIGTNNGVCRMDKLSGSFTQVKPSLLNANVVNTLLTTDEGSVFIGTDHGLFCYFPETDSCGKCELTPSYYHPWPVAIQHLYQDSQRHLWVATSSGLFRLEASSGKVLYYSGFTATPHVVFEDSRGNIWIGTYGQGLCLMENPYDMENVRWQIFQCSECNSKRGLCDNNVYAITEDVNTNSLWIGTRGGLSIISDIDNPATSFMTYKSRQNEPTFNELNALIRDRQGSIWLGMLGGGVCYTNTMKPMFELDNLREIRDEIPSSAIRSMYLDDDNLWIGIGSYGFAVKNLTDGRITHYEDIPRFSGMKNLPTINRIRRLPSTGEIWLATFSVGIYVYNENAPEGRNIRQILDNGVSLPSRCVYDVLEDKDSVVWVATRSGLCLIDNSGSANIEREGLPTGYCYCLAQDSDGNIWVGTGSNGAVCIVPDKTDRKNDVVKNYSTENGRLNCPAVQCIFEDSRKRVWLGTDGGGANIYCPEVDSFIALNTLLNIPGDGVFSIEEDNSGDIWMGTNVGLVRISNCDTIENGKFRLYTTRQGLQDNVFMLGVSAKASDGKLYFGGHFGFNSFYPGQIDVRQSYETPVTITDIKIYNTSWNKLDEETRNRVSKEKPEFARKITVGYRETAFTIEFAGLNYTDPKQIQYEYRLKGFDQDWQMADATRRFAYYNNMNPGNYSFEVKALNDNGEWSSPRQLDVTVLPPPWKTWWAYSIYIAVVLLIVSMLSVVFINRLSLRNALHLKEMENSKIEEMNHAKLQFFTNITHELLTPLTIVSASIDELKMVAPNNDSIYRVITQNTNRLIRLLQQILEFRKAETGNLKLRVSKGDIATFTKNSLESFRPLMKKKKLHFSLICNPESFTAYFDPDKMDKILYNLLSNAAKYNREGGTVLVDLNLEKEKQQAILTVKDNGNGMSIEAQKNLFKRFYEGDYRKFNTIGTGIGLSLTKDLVELHGGEISAESVEGEGSTFKVVIPISRDAYRDDQIDDTYTPMYQSAESLQSTLIAKDEFKEPAKEKSHSLLLVEDNEELLQLMNKLLGYEYNTYTAQTGKEAVEIIEQEDIDLVVSDVMMPEMNGIELCRHIKGNFEYCHIPVVLLTAKNLEEDRVEAYDSGADGFISKPFNLSVLHAKIKNLLKARDRGISDFKKQLVFEVKDLNYTSMDEDFLQRAIDCVHNHIADCTFDQQQFMDDMGVSKSTLYKKLKSLTDLNTSAFIRNIRLKAACQIAENNRSIRISELAYAVGFNDPKYFSTCFKKEFGMLPSEYIERFTSPSEHNT